MKILFCIIHTQHQPDRYNNIIKTWGSNINYLIYSDHENLSQNIYKVSDRSDYSSGQEKQIKVFNLLKNKNNYDWYFFCDNDTFVNTKLLYHKLNSNYFDPMFIHGSIINCWPNDKSLFYPSGGAGFLVSSPILQDLIDSDLMTYLNLPYSDVSLGLNCRSLNINFMDHDLFKSQKPDYYDIPLNQTNKYISFHYITNYELMNSLYELSL